MARGNGPKLALGCSLGLFVGALIVLAIAVATGAIEHIDSNTFDRLLVWLKE